MDSAMRALKSNHLNDAIKLCEQAMDMARTFGPHDSRLSRSQVLRAEIAMWEKKYDRAEQLFQEAVATCEQAVGPKHRDLVHPLSSLANFYYYVVPHRDRVAVLFERILDLVDHAPNRDERDVIMWSRNLGMIYRELEDFTRAEPLYARAVALAQKVEPDWVSHEYLSSAEFYRAWKKYDRAEALALQALELREQGSKAAPDNVDRKLDVAVALDELGAIHTAAQKLEAAEADCRRSLKIIEAFMTADQPDLRPRLTALASVLNARGKLDEASTVYQRLLTLTEKNLGGESPELATVMSNYAAVLHQQKKAKEAVAMEERAAAIRNRAATM